MKYVAILCLLTNIVHGQISIDDSDMPSAGDIEIVSIAAPTSVSTPELTGPNYSWDFSLLTSTQQRVDTFQTVGATPVAYQFFFNNQFLYPDHVADFAVSGIDFPNVIPQLTVSEVINYFAVDNGSYRQVGFGANINGIPASIRFQPTDSNYVFPLNYGDVSSNIYTYSLNVPSTLYYGQDGVRTDTVDGWGSIQTPYGTFNALRIKSTLNKTDTTYLDLLGTGTSINRPIEIEYKWLAAGENIPVMKIVTTGGQVSTVEYKDDSQLSVPVEQMNLEFSLFPNPTTESITINYDGHDGNAMKYVVYDMSGRIVLGDDMIMRRSTVDVSQLSPGQYLIQVHGQNVSGIKEFQVVR